jgi:hypothetical protein
MTPADLGLARIWSWVVAAQRRGEITDHVPACVSSDPAYIVPDRLVFGAVSISVDWASERRNVAHGYIIRQRGHVVATVTDSDHAWLHVRACRLCPASLRRLALLPDPTPPSPPFCPPQETP